MLSVFGFRLANETPKFFRALCDADDRETDIASLYSSRSSSLGKSMAFLWRAFLGKEQQVCLVQAQKSYDTRNLVAKARCASSRCSEPQKRRSDANYPCNSRSSVPEASQPSRITLTCRAIRV
jgi:hypothetical protein